MGNIKKYLGGAQTFGYTRVQYFPGHVGILYIWSDEVSEYPPFYTKT